MLVASNTGAKLLAELWDQRKPAPPGSTQPESLIPPLPAIDVVKQEATRELGDGHELHLDPHPHAPLARGPDRLRAEDRPADERQVLRRPPLQRGVGRKPDSRPRRTAAITTTA